MSTVVSEHELQETIAQLEAQLTETPEDRAERLHRLDDLHKRAAALKDQIAHREWVQRKIASVPMTEKGIENLKRLIELAESNAQKALDAYVAAVDERAPHAQGHLAPLEYERKVEAASRAFAAARVHVARHKANLAKSEALLQEAKREVAQLQ